MSVAQQVECTVLCVDDNPHVADALRMLFSRGQWCRWLGWLPDATDLAERVKAVCPMIVLLDLDMPGPDPFEAIAEITAHCPETRTIIFSGHVRKDLIDRAIEAGVWGYVSKNDGEGVLVEAIRKILGGEFALGPEVRAALDG